MNINETLKVIEYGIKHYRDDKMGTNFTMIDYYSLTDLAPNDLYKTAIKLKCRSVAAALIIFQERKYWDQRKINFEERLNSFHSIRGVELTKEDKMAIRDYLVKEGYPVIDGTFDLAARYYASGNIEEISKEKVKEKILKAYYGRNHAEYENNNNKVKLLKK